MAFIKRILKKFQRQTLVYWEKLGTDSFGQPTYKTPIQLSCRWEDVSQEVVLADKRKVVTHAYLLMAVELIPGSLVFQGTLDQVKKVTTYPEKPLTFNQGAREVLKTNGTPDLQAKETLYESYL